MTFGAHTPRCFLTNMHTIRSRFFVSFYSNRKPEQISASWINAKPMKKKEKKMNPNEFSWMNFLHKFSRILAARVNNSLWISRWNWVILVANFKSTLFKKQMFLTQSSQNIWISCLAFGNLLLSLLINYKFYTRQSSSSHCQVFTIEFIWFYTTCDFILIQSKSGLKASRRNFTISLRFL